jgi:hypothetical protein
MHWDLPDRLNLSAKGQYSNVDLSCTRSKLLRPVDSQAWRIDESDTFAVREPSLLYGTYHDAYRVEPKVSLQHLRQACVIATLKPHF